MAQLPAVIDTKQAIERYKSGETIKQIAKSFGCSHVALYNRLLAESPEEWKAVASSNALANFEEAEEELRTAPDMLTVTRARAWAELQRWKLENLLRKYFGRDQAVVVNDVRVVIAGIDDPLPVVVEQKQGE